MKNKILNYTILYSSNIEKVIKDVKDDITHGWQPLGHVDTVIQNGTTLFIQTMVKYCDIKT